MQVISPLHVYLNSTRVVEHYEVWRLVSNFFYFGKLGNPPLSLCCRHVEKHCFGVALAVEHCNGVHFMASETNWMLCLLDMCSSLLSPCQWSFQRGYSSLTQIVSMVSSQCLARCMSCFQINFANASCVGLCACMSQISTFCSICFSLQGTASYWKRPHFEGAQQISSSCCSLVEAC